MLQDVRSLLINACPKDAHKPPIGEVPRKGPDPHASVDVDDPSAI